MTITAEGLTISRFVSLRAELADRIKRRQGDSIDLSNGSMYGHIVSLLALRLAQSQERFEQFRECLDPDAAVDNPLESLAMMAGLLGRDAGELNSALRGRREEYLLENAVRNKTCFNELYRQLVALGEPDHPTTPWEVFDVMLDGTYGNAGEAEILVLASGTVTEWGDPVAEAILAYCAGGIQIETMEASTQAISADDSTGRTHNYTVGIPSAIDIELDITVTTNSLYPGDDILKIAALPPSPEGLVVTEDTVHVTRMGYPVVLSHILCRILDTVPGITAITVEGNISPGTAAEFDIDIASNEYASYDVADMTVI